MRDFDVVVIGAGLAGIAISNELARGNFSVLLLEKGASIAPYDDSKNYTTQKSNLLFTRGMGEGGTTNFWHSGLIKIPKDNKWAKENLYTGNWYDKAIEYLGIDNCEIISDSAIYYPSKKIRMTASSEVVCNCGVSNIVINHTENTITYFFESLMHKFSFKELVISAGGLGTPLLLTDENNRRQFNDIGIGRNLCDHFTFPIGKIKFSKWKLESFSKKVKGGSSKLAYSVKDEITGLSHLFITRPTFTKRAPNGVAEIKKHILSDYYNRKYLRLFLRMVCNFDFILEVIAYKIKLPIPTRYIQFNVVSEQFDTNNNYIRTVSNESADISWKISHAEINSAYRSFDKLLKNFKEISESLVYEFDIKNYNACCHHTGAARMSTPEKDGVVDTGFKIRGLSNVYICDGSVIPNSSYANTGLTIVALALKLSRIIKDKYKCKY